MYMKKSRATQSQIPVRMPRRFSTERSLIKR
ncbi:MAG: hypothetical protein H6Q67_741, partial [Firmicutes bacterium]|nr:hypothetical protein [Bacillota bacterium]